MVLTLLHFQSVLLQGIMGSVVLTIGVLQHWQGSIAVFLIGKPVIVQTLFKLLWAYKHRCTRGGVCERKREKEIKKKDLKKRQTHIEKCQKGALMICMCVCECSLNQWMWVHTYEGFPSDCRQRLGVTLVQSFGIRGKLLCDPHWGLQIQLALVHTYTHIYLFSIISATELWGDFQQQVF